MTVHVVALGHPDRGDDAVGGLVADRVADEAGVVVHRLPGDPSRLLDEPWWGDDDRVVLVDAVVTGAAPGTVHRWSVPALLRPGAATTTQEHGLGLVAVLALADALGRLPRDATVVGVEAASFDTGAPPTPAVLAAVDAAAALVRAVLAGQQVRGAAPARR